VVVVYGRCRELGEMLPYAPLREAIGQLAGGLDRLDASRKAEIQTGMFRLLAVIGMAVPVALIVEDLMG